MNIRKEAYVPPLIRPSGTFSHREKAWGLDVTTPYLGHLTCGEENPLSTLHIKSAKTRSASILLAGSAASCRRKRGAAWERQDAARPAAWKAALRPSGAWPTLCAKPPLPSGGIRRASEVQRSRARCCRGSGSGRLAGGEVPAAPNCSQLPPPERASPNIVPRQPAREDAERPQVSALRAYLEPPASTRIWPVPPPRAGVAARYFVRCVPGVGAASTSARRARHPRLTSYCRCRGNARRSSLELLRTLKLALCSRRERLHYVFGLAAQRPNSRPSPTGRRPSRHQRSAG